MRFWWGLALGLALAGPAWGVERSLYWREIRVAAHLEASGELAIAETWRIVFTGDWNGGERRFRVGFGEDLELRGLTRIEPGGREIPLVKGKLDRVDRFRWASERTLRWRSRLPADPPFDQTELAYRLDYSVRGVVHPVAEGKYRLAYNFLFPDRPGPVERFTLDLTLDPAWQPQGIVPGHVEERDVAPDVGFGVPLDLAYRGPGAPAAVPVPPPAERVGGLWGLVLLVILPALLLRLVWRERRLGRFATSVVPREWDERTLRRELFTLLPEEVGALWDRKSVV